MIGAIILMFMAAYAVQRFARADLDRKARWTVLGIRWAAVVVAILGLAALAFWDRGAEGNDSVRLVLSYSLLAASYAIGEWLTRRYLSRHGIEIRETIRGANY